MNLDKPKFEPIRTCVAPQTEIDDKDTPKYEPIKMCEKPKTEQDDRKNPKSRPGITFTSPNTEKAGIDDIASKPKDTPKLSKHDDKSKKIDKLSQKPKDKPKNKIEPRKIDTKKEPKHKLQPRKINPNAPPKHKIQPRKIDSNRESINKIKPRNIDPKIPTNHKIEPRKRNPNKDSKHKIHPQHVTPEKSKNKIECVPTSEAKNTAKLELTQPAKQPKKKPLIVGKQKECGRCHETKSINEFEMYMSNRNNVTKTKYERYCRPCRLEYKQVRALTNKTNIIRNINGGKFGEKCSECDTTIAKLPAFDFHHPIKELKTKPINFHGNWEKVLKRLEKEKAIPSCRNCHLKEQSKYYNKYKNLIEHKNKFETSLEGIEKKLYKQIYKQYPGIGHKEGHQIKSWMSKRIVIDRLYNGGCLGCREKNLATLQFHHRDIEKKTFQKYDKLRYTTLEKIEKKLIQDDAVCLCGNCHRMVTSKYYKNNHQEIVGSKYSQEIKGYFRDLNESVKNYKFPANILKQYPFIKTEKIVIGEGKAKSYKLNPDEKRIKNEILAHNWKGISQNWKLPSGELLDPSKESSRTNPLYKHENWLKTIYSNKNWGLTDLKIARLTNTSNTTINYWRNKLQIPVKNSIPQNRKHGSGEAWKKYLFHISKLSREGKTVQTKTLAESVGVKPSITRVNIRKLKSKGLITIIGEHKNRKIFLTENGKNESHKIYQNIV